MNIESIKIKNFRNIGDQETTFVLNPSFTVFIGINGKGKSTILHALRVACGTFFLAIPEVKKWHIRPDEIRQKDAGKLLIPQKPVLVEAKGTFPNLNAPIVWRRQILENSNSTTSSESDVGTVRNLGKEKYNKITKESNDRLDLPIIAFFGTSRAHGAGRNRKSRIGRQIFKEGYQDWFEMKSTTFQYENWLASYDILEKSGKEYRHTKKAFFETLKRANRFIKEIQDVGGKLWLKVEVQDTTSDLLPIELHSDGIRFFTEMVAELSYRCIILNGYLEEKVIEESRGIVMIDEIDLHLHPTWQKEVVKDLKTAFPNIQFVVTTHSPFIVQSLESNELINLDKISDVTPKNLSLDEVAENIMGVESSYSTENANDENISKEYLVIVNDLGSSYMMNEPNNALSKLDELEKKISDPAVRAFLKMKRLKNDPN